MNGFGHTHDEPVFEPLGGDTGPGNLFRMKDAEDEKSVTVTVPRLGVPKECITVELVPDAALRITVQRESQQSVVDEAHGIRQSQASRSRLNATNMLPAHITVRGATAAYAEDGTLVITLPKYGGPFTQADFGQIKVQ